MVSFESRTIVDGDHHTEPFGDSLYSELLAKLFQHWNALGSVSSRPAHPTSHRGILIPDITTNSRVTGGNLWCADDYDNDGQDD